MKKIKKFLNTVMMMVTIVIVVTTLFGNGNKLMKCGRLTINEIKYQVGIKQYPDWLVEFATITEERWSK